MTDNDADIMARTIWGEARNQGLLGMEAVASVIMNRLAVSNAKGGYWWGNNITDICMKLFQFSCWNPKDPNLEKLHNVDLNDKQFSSAIGIAHKAIEKQIPDMTGGATSYHTKTSYPKWSEDMVQTKIIGDHIFYK